MVKSNLSEVFYKYLFTIAKQDKRILIKNLPFSYH